MVTRDEAVAAAKRTREQLIKVKEPTRCMVPNPCALGLPGDRSHFPSWTHVRSPVVLHPNKEDDYGILEELQHDATINDMGDKEADGDDEMTVTSRVLQ